MVAQEKELRWVQDYIHIREDRLDGEQIGRTESGQGGFDGMDAGPGEETVIARTADLLGDSL
jgi:hypothetical protein